MGLPDEVPQSVLLWRTVRTALKAGTLTSIAGTASYLAILATSISFAAVGPQFAELRSLLVPLTLLFGGVSMLFSLPAQIAGARGSRLPGALTVRGWAVWTLTIAAAFGLLALICSAVFSTFAHGLIDQRHTPNHTVRFLSLMAVGYLPLACSDFIEGFLRGSGRFLQASSLVVARALIICLGYVGAVHLLHADPLLLPWFYALGGLTTFLIGAAYTLSMARRQPREGAESTVQTRSLVLRVGLPVLASYVLLSTVVGVQIAGVDTGLGSNAQIAFSGMQMVQALCVVAATGIAAGVSSEVLRRAAHNRVRRAELGTIIARTGNVILLIEAGVLIVFLAVAHPVLDVLLVGVKPTSTITVGAILLVVNALLIANDVFVLTVLEEIGLAALSLILNAIYFVALIAVTYLTAALGTFTTLGIGLVALSTAGAIGLRILLRHLPRITTMD